MNIPRHPCFPLAFLPLACRPASIAAWVFRSMAQRVSASWPTSLFSSRRKTSSASPAGSICRLMNRLGRSAFRQPIPTSMLNIPHRPRRPLTSRSPISAATVPAWIAEPMPGRSGADREMAMACWDWIYSGKMSLDRTSILALSPRTWPMRNISSAARVYPIRAASIPTFMASPECTACRFGITSAPEQAQRNRLPNRRLRLPSPSVRWHLGRICISRYCYMSHWARICEESSGLTAWISGWTLKRSKQWHTRNFT